MKKINEVIDLFEETAGKSYKVYYGFNVDAPAPSVRYEVSFEDGDNVRHSVLNAVFNLLFVGKVESSLKNSHTTLIANMQKIKQELVAKGFQFQSILEAVEFDSKGNVTDAPAKIMIFKHLVEF